MTVAMYDELVQKLLSVLPGETVRIVLYGSAARGERAPDSDIDIALFLNRKLTAEQEDRLMDAVTDLNLKYDQVFSVIDIDQETFLRWKYVTPFYQNVEKEGIVLWRAA